MKDFFHSKRRQEISKYCYSFANILFAALFASDLFIKGNLEIIFKITFVLVGAIIVGIAVTPKQKENQ